MKDFLYLLACQRMQPFAGFEAGFEQPPVGCEGSAIEFVDSE